MLEGSHAPLPSGAIASVSFRLVLSSLPPSCHRTRAKQAETRPHRPRPFDADRPIQLQSRVSSKSRLPVKEELKPVAERGVAMSQVGTLYGWWALTSFVLETQGFVGQQRPWGEKTFGRLVLSPDGQIMVMILFGDRTPGRSEADHAALFRSMLAYTGTYRVEEGKFITTVSGSWNEEWTGTDEERFYELHGDRLDIVTAWGPHPFDPSSPPARGILSWRRER